MFRNYVISALRSSVRHRLYTFINLIGLSVALTCAIFIALFVRDELSYDKWIPGNQNVYRVETISNYPGFPPTRQTAAPFPLAAAMKADIPEVRDSAREVVEEMTVQRGHRQFRENISFVDPNFLAVIQLPLKAGNRNSVFSNPNSIVLTQATARKYFGNQNPIGKTLTLDGKYPLTVTGILHDPPHDSTFQEAIFASNRSSADMFHTKQMWFDLETMIYVRLIPDANLGAVLSQTRAIIRKNANPSRFMRTNLTGDQILQPLLVNLGSIHLEGTGAGSWTKIYGFIAIAILILAIACFNFINLATARAVMRAREVGLRKILGAHRRQLIFQFLGEALLNTTFALAIALAAVELMTPSYDRFLGRSITFQSAASWPFVVMVIGVTLLVGLLSGIYPAFVLSSFRPVTALRAGFIRRTGSGLLRTGLVVVQFAVSIGLGIATIVVFSQIHYAQKVNLGFNRSDVVVLSGLYHVPQVRRETLIQHLRSSPYVTAVTQSSAVPFGRSWQGTAVSMSVTSGSTLMRILSASPSFYQFYGIRLLAGRLLSSTRSLDIMSGDPYNGKVSSGRNILVNAAAASELGLSPQQAVGKIVYVGSTHAAVRIVGVIGNTRFRGAFGKVDPTVYIDRPYLGYTVSIRLKKSELLPALAFIDEAWHQYAPNFAIDRHFLSVRFNKLFVADQRQGAMFGLFVLIAIFIACLGLFGLAAFTTERRTKEIGIRKTLGAKTIDIVMLLLWQFSLPVLLANVIAWPVAWYYLRDWLQGFSVRIALSPSYFLAAGFVALAIAWITVATHAVRVAGAKAVDSLRYE
ncbi:MAG: ABC transporter permease [Rhizomicrobium sp.]